MFPAPEPEPLHRAPDPEVFQTFEGRSLHEEQAYLFQTPWFSALLSAGVMGLGQLFNGQSRRGLTFLFGQISLLLYAWDHTSGRIVSEALTAWFGATLYGLFFWGLMLGGVAVWLFNIYDAYEVARFVSFIYDRHSQVLLLDDEEEDVGGFAAERRDGMRRGQARQAGYVAAGVLLYTLFIFGLGARISGGGEGGLDGLRARLGRSSNPALHLNAARFFLGLDRHDDARHEYAMARKFARSNMQRRAADEGLARVDAILAGIPDPGDPDEGISPLPPTYQPIPTVSPDRPLTALATRVPAPSLLDGPPPLEPGPDSGGAIPVRPVTPGVDLEYALERAELELSLGNPEGAKAALEPLAQVSMASARLERVRGELLRQNGDLIGARQALERAVEMAPGDPRGYLLLSDVAKAEGRTGETEGYLRRAVVASPEDPDAVRRFARHLAASSRAQEAYEVVSRALTGHPSDQELLFLSFVYSREAGNSERAYEAARALDRGGYRDGEVYAFLTTRALAANQQREAQRLMQVLKQVAPRHAKAVPLEAEVLLRQRKAHQALELLRPWVGSGSLEVAVLLAQAAKQTKEYQLGIQSLQSALELHPPTADALKLLGILYKRTGSLEQALKSYQRATELAPGDKEALYLAGYIHYRKGDFSQGVSVYQKVQRYDPGYGETDFYLAACLEGLGRTSAAIDAYERVPERSSNRSKAIEGLRRLRNPASAVAPRPTAPAVTSTPVASRPPAPPSAPAVSPSSDFVPQPYPAPKPPRPTTVSVDAYASTLRDAEMAFGNGKLERALAKYQAVLAIKADHFRSYFQRGLILRDLNRAEEAIEAFQVARALDPKHVTNLTELGQILAELKRYGPAVTVFEEAVRVEPQNLAVRYKLGVLYERLRGFDKAEEQYQSIIWYHPEYNQAHEYLGNVYYKQAKYQKASGSFELLLKGEPENMVVRFKLGLTYLQLKQRDRAKGVLTDLLSRLPADHPLRPQVQSYADGLKG